MLCQCSHKWHHAVNLLRLWPITTKALGHSLECPLWLLIPPRGSGSRGRPAAAGNTAPQVPSHHPCEHTGALLWELHPLAARPSFPGGCLQFTGRGHVSLEAFPGCAGGQCPHLNVAEWPLPTQLCEGERKDSTSHRVPAACPPAGLGSVCGSRDQADCRSHSPGAHSLEI